MCGLVGIAGTINKADLDAFAFLLIIDGVRGMHSTGMAVVDRDTPYNADVHKLAVTPYEFIQTRRFEKILTTDAQVLMGHNRHATIGKINSINAHPFDNDWLVGAHNGTLNNKHSLDDYLEFGTDSEAMFFNIGKNGLDNTVSKLRGAWAMTFYNYENQSINFLRNKERPFHFCLSESRQAMYWASEASMLTWSLKQAGIKHTKIYQLAEDSHLELDIPEKGKMFPLVRAMKGTRVEGAGPHRPAAGYWENGRYLEDKEKDKSKEVNKGGSQGSTEGKPTGTQTSKTLRMPKLISTPPTPTSHSNPLLSELQVRLKAQDDWIASEKKRWTTVHDGAATWPSGTPGEYKGYGGRILTKQEFEDATKDGCAWCAISIDWGDTVRFLSPNDCVCMDCNENEELKKIIGA